MRLKQSMNKWSNIAIFMIFAMLVMAIAIYILIDDQSVAMISFGFGLAYLFGFIVVVFLLIAVHELGHLLAARVSDMNVSGFCVGPLRWIKEKGEWRFSLFNDARVAGFVLALPKSSEFDRKQYMIFISGGPIASLIAALLILSAYLSLTTFQLLVLPHLFIATFFALNLVPFRIGGVATDGHWLFSLLFTPKEAEKRLVTQRLFALAQNGVPTKEWPVEVVSTLRGIKGKTVEALQARLFEMTYGLAVEDSEMATVAANEAEEVIDAHDLVDVTGRFIPVLLLQIANVRAISEEDPVKARTALDKVQKVPESLSSMYHMVMCYVLLLEGDEEGGLSEIRLAVPLLIEQLRDMPRILSDVIKSFGGLSERAGKVAIEAYNETSRTPWAT